MAIDTQNDWAQFLVNCWQAGVDRVKGDRAVALALEEDGIQSIDNLLAVGKAGCAMALGAMPYLSQNARALVITKYDHSDPQLVDDDRFTVLESAHPVPDSNSLESGRMALEFVENIPRGQSLVVLVSGGASSLVESLPEGMDLDQLAELNRSLLAEGFDITRMNAVRTCLSAIKGGKLLSGFRGADLACYAISDVPGDDLSVIGSGIGATMPTGAPDFPLPENVQALLDR